MPRELIEPRKGDKRFVRRGASEANLKRSMTLAARWLPTVARRQEGC